MENILDFVVYLEIYILRNMHKIIEGIFYYVFVSEMV